MRIQVTTKMIPISLAVNFHQVVSSIPAMASAPMTTPEVGVIKLTIPLADWKAVTTICCATPTKLPSGPIIPIVAEASPDVDGIRKDSGI